MFFKGFFLRRIKKTAWQLPDRQLSITAFNQVHFWFNVVVIKKKFFSFFQLHEGFIVAFTTNHKFFWNTKIRFWTKYKRFLRMNPEVWVLHTSIASEMVRYNLDLFWNFLLFPVHFVIISFSFAFDFADLLLAGCRLQYVPLSSNLHAIALFGVGFQSYTRTSLSQLPFPRSHLPLCIQSLFSGISVLWQSVRRIHVGQAGVVCLLTLHSRPRHSAD